MIHSVWGKVVEPQNEHACQCTRCPNAESWLDSYSSCGYRFLCGGLCSWLWIWISVVDTQSWKIQQHPNASTKILKVVLLLTRKVKADLFAKQLAKHSHMNPSQSWEYGTQVYIPLPVLRLLQGYDYLVTSSTHPPSLHLSHKQLPSPCCIIHYASPCSFTFTPLPVHCHHASFYLRTCSTPST